MVAHVLCPKCIWSFKNKAQHVPWCEFYFDLDVGPVVGPSILGSLSSGPGRQSYFSSID